MHIEELQIYGLVVNRTLEINAIRIAYGMVGTVAGRLHLDSRNPFPLEKI